VPQVLPSNFDYKPLSTTGRAALDPGEPGGFASPTGALWLHCGDVSLAQIVQAVGTPCYVYDLDRVRANYRRLAEAVSPLGARLHYSLKANANLALIRALLAEGADLDAVSGGEIYRALRAGAAAADIVFAGVGKTAEELQYALEVGVGCFNVESVGELDRLNALAGQMGKTARVALRINPAIQANTHRFIATGHAAAKFGIAEDDARDLLKHQARYAALAITGIHVHIGSQLGSVQETVEAAEHALRLFDTFPTLRDLNLGGGFPVRYTAEDVFPAVEDFAQGLLRVLDGRRNVRLSFEPGRYIVAEAGALLMAVQYIKMVGDQRIIITDAGMTELIRPMLYGAVHPIYPVRLDDAKNQTAGLSAAQVVGPICESTDVMAHAAMLPTLNPGDLLAVLVAGAYGAVMSSNYNARPRPPEVVVEGRRWSVARRRETWGDLLSLEI
jgi:diaminopimelate decarboxylase